jgi:hypothetical protein
MMRMLAVGDLVWVAPAVYPTNNPLGFVYRVIQTFEWSAPAGYQWVRGCELDEDGGPVQLRTLMLPPAEVAWLPSAVTSLAW